MDDPASSASSDDDATAPRYSHDDLIIKTISTIDDGNGVDFDELFDYCKESYAIPPDYRELLYKELTKLVSKKKLEKVETRYKIVEGTVIRAANPAQTSSSEDSPQELSSPEDSTESQELPSTPLSSENRLEKAESAAKALAVVDSKVFEAKEASEVADTAQKKLEKSAMALELAKEVSEL
ncbi:hypothetical protein Bca52824_033239 [Brassica carinata]|uniref:H15 domain-containing protein n=1 Tax=Brassica carinata TaxID=52824 RepID=A0A8X7SE44_BRACI|nr:hypothetical protein Bca52824_033239 [Brassica carinata]